MLAMVIAAIVLVSRQLGHEASANTRQANVEKGVSGSFYPTPGQWASLTVEPVATETFREELVTEGKIAVDEDHATAIYSPYTGRVTKLLVAPGDKVNGGQPLFVLEAADSVLIQNDFIAALSAYNKARSQVSLTDTVEQRQHGLYDSKATSLREWQQAQADFTAARLDLQSAQTALEANRNRLRIIGKSDAEIDAISNTRWRFRPRRRSSRLFRAPWFSAKSDQDNTSLLARAIPF